MKVIFLDIDGVICTRRPGILEHDLKLNLLRLVQSTGAKIVLSTDWRRAREARQAIRDDFKPLGMGFIGWTPIIGSFPMNNRPVEILQWIRTHHANGKERVEEWVCIDDRDLPTERGGRGVANNYVKTFPARGLTPAKVDECAKILNEGMKWDDKLLVHIPSSLVGAPPPSTLSGVPLPSASVVAGARKVMMSTSPPTYKANLGGSPSPLRGRPMASTARAGVGGGAVGVRPRVGGGGGGGGALVGRFQKMNIR